MTIHPLSDDCALSQEVLPSVLAGYKKSQSVPDPKAVEQLAEVLQEVYQFSTEEASKVSTHFWTASLHDFCVQYLDNRLTDEDHAKILKTADGFVKNGTIVRIDENETDLIKLLAVKVAMNVHQQAHEYMLNACFLNEMNMLPKENVFMLQKGISPVFYEKDEFERAEMLKDKALGVPEDRLSRAFTNWLYRAGIRYIPAFKQMKELSRDKGCVDGLIIRKAMASYRMQKRRMERHRRLRPRRHIWRSYGE